MTNRIKMPALLMTVLVAGTGCSDLLDVDNPNNLVEESIRQEAAASAVVNGALSLTADAVSQIWQPYLVASDELEWIGSRDAWLSLDQGFLSDPNNEFTDGAFPSLGEARWMGDEAIEILQMHVDENPASTNFRSDLARANLFSGIMYMVIGEVQEDFAFSDKTEDGAPVGPQQMRSVLEGAISRLDQAVSIGTDLGSTDLVTRALAVRARAKQSLAIWDKINPTASGTNGLVDGGAADAMAVLARVGDDWRYDFTYSAGTVGNSMASWVNDRKENTIDRSLVTRRSDQNITGVALLDPIDGVPDDVVRERVEHFRAAAINPEVGGSQYSPLTVTSGRLMLLILAESALAKGDNAGFTTYINRARALNDKSPYTGQMSAIELLKHERRVGTMFMGLRLADMYRFGIREQRWDPNGDAVAAPGTMLPITIIEIRANCYLNGSGCGS